MDDQDLMKQIQNLVDEEHQLLKLEEEGKLSGDQHERVRAIEVKLDQFWDLLRQRRARRQAGQDPNDAHERDANTVEHYLQ